MLVERAPDDVETAVTVQIGQRGRAQEATLDVVVGGDRAVGCVEAGMRCAGAARVREGGAEPHREAAHRGSVEVPRVGPLSGCGDDVSLAIAVDIADPGPAMR